ncbi:transglutaminase domain-containing protein [Aureibaculum sp. 2210JD6-5]|uniref:transglutaminase domain-containing protein n=1 Tax=Aureibaculum sp. 2210JD6-5 TaxID=3103957 RepID=UPI002AAD1CBF|nr:transglutaminase domain-containing protein [Aureibaculum sp. 2210JD6-5]MDY7394729.1 transglutaminase domain-containing protein [Aureibaculum sp. 2210JD6-5]
MRHLTIYLLFILCSNLLFGQEFTIAGHLNSERSSHNLSEQFNSDFNTVDAKVRDYGANYNSSSQLAEQILKDFDTKKDRIRALYTWLCLNIRYDMASFKSGQTEIGFSYTSKVDFDRKMKAINKSIVNKTLKSKKAICEGYAQTFKEVSEHLGIQCKLIGGYAKGDVTDINNPPAAENHAWNTVKIDKKWYLVDVTWGAGSTNGNRWTAKFDDFYFFTDPEKFALTHYPSEKEWLLTNIDLTKKQFFSLPIFKKSFFTNKLKLISPKSGTIEVSTNNDITFLMGNIPQNINLYYAFKGDKYSQKIQVNCNNEQCTFNIPFTKNSDSELYIFANQKPILEFYVKRK